jgi:Holliday junction resolvasome RuvABC endonuclease subunit
MQTVMGLDVSSSCIGLSLISENNSKFELIKLESYKPDKKNGLFDSLLKTQKHIREILKEWKPDTVVIEDIAQHFAGGASSAGTIITLAIYNRMIGLTVYETTGKDPELLNVNTVRSIIRPKNISGKLPKEDVPEVVAAILNIEFPYIYKKKGNIDPESYDRADSIAVAVAYAALQISKKEKKAKKCTCMKHTKSLNLKKGLPKKK